MADETGNNERSESGADIVTYTRRDTELMNKATAEIERLRDKVQDLRMHLEQDACEIERLRAAGDALVAAIRNHDLHESQIKEWQEARRG